MSKVKKVFVEAINIVKKYVTENDEINYALNDVSIKIYSGEVLALLGENGAGKTTLSSVVATLLKPTAGEILFEGKAVFENLYDYRKQIGFCPQKPNLYPNLTIGENLFYAGRVFGLTTEESQQQVDRLLEKYSLTRYKNQLIHNLSGGYQQRALIARTLMHSPKMVLFDEPTVGLDPHIRREIWNEILNLKKEGVAIVLTTHYLDEAEFLADSVCVLSKGEVKYYDTPKKLKSDLKKNTLEEVLSDLILSKE